MLFFHMARTPYENPWFLSPVGSRLRPSMFRRTSCLLPWESQRKPATAGRVGFGTAFGGSFLIARSPYGRAGEAGI